MRRRDLLALSLSSMAFTPLAARAQQRALPVIGFLDPRFPEDVVDRLRGFRQGLKEVGYSERETVTIEYRWAENQLDRLPALAADLARRGVAIIVASGGADVVLAAKGATTTIPILFIVSGDPVKLGLVTSLARPDGNLTGINFFNAELVAKRLEILRELVPRAKRVAALVNPTDVRNTEATLTDLELAARSFGLQIEILKANTSREIDDAFEIIGRERPDALFVGQAAYLNSRRVQLVQLAASRMIPTSYASRESPEIGGLMSYGSDITDAYRQIGAYTGRILNGAKPADLPVVRASKFELIINAQTARMLRLAVPQSLLARADEVIE
jgi:putative tryptophan/tyrosine transport system substrate-binding protein